MANDINSCTFSGRLTRAPRFAMSQSGVPYINIGLANNQSLYDPATGRWDQSTTFIDGVAFAETAEAINAMRLTTGTKVVVCGSMQTEPRMVPGTGIIYNQLVFIISDLDAAPPRPSQWKAGIWRNGTDSQ